MKEAKTWIAKQDNLAQVASEIVPELLKSSPFVLWLKGDLGAGKTTFTKSVLRALGLPDNVPVLSPTYTWLTEYQIPSGFVAHMDLYRLSDHDHDSVAMLLSGRSYRGLIIEWPERAETFDLIAPSGIVEISATPVEDERKLSFFL